jgi:prophage maintenance system killer protein
MSRKQAKKQQKLPREQMPQKIEPPIRASRFHWGIFMIALLSVISLSAFGFSGGFSSENSSPKVSEKAISNAVHTIDDEEITPETWRGINLEVSKNDGSMAKVHLLRPLWWLEGAGAKVGGTIALSMPEMGIEGEAKVLAINPCKADSRKEAPGYRTVTGKFAHENAIVLDLCFNHNPNELLGVTSNHPLWSETRHGWIGAGDLAIGELVKTKDGVAQLTMRSQRPGRHKVYNLEVHKDHTYYVSNLGILAHNSCVLSSADDIIQANLKYSNGMSYDAVDKVIANMYYREGLLDKTAVVIRDIAGGHLFHNGNKRTAQAIAEQMINSNGGSVTPERIRFVIDQVGQGTLKTVEEISTALKISN